MASESTPPPPTSGGARYAIVGVALAALAGLGWCLTRPPDAPTTTTALPDAGHISHSTALVEDSLDIPDPEPDAGPPIDAGAPVVEPPHHSSSGGTARPPAGEWDRCSGEITAATALAEVRNHDRQIRNCYERRLRDNPLLTGTMNLSLMIGADGSVSGVRTAGTLRDREFTTCVRAEAMRMHFPRVTGGPCTVVAVPYSFTPEN